MTDGTGIIQDTGRWVIKVYGRLSDRHISSSKFHDIYTQEAIHVRHPLGYSKHICIASLFSVISNLFNLGVLDLFLLKIFLKIQASL